MFKNFLLHFVIIFAGVLLTSCVSTKIASIKDPSYRNASFKRFLVIANYEKMVDVQKIESMLVKRLNFKGVYAIANSSLLPPIREYTEDEKKNAFITENLDCYLIISQIGENKSTVYIPPTSTTETEVKTSRHKVSETTTTVTTPGGEREIVSTIDTKAELYDIQNGNLVWRGEATTSCQPGVIGDIFDSFCSNIVEELQKNYLLK
jgi:hypothetical protein